MAASVARQSGSTMNVWVIAARIVRPFSDMGRGTTPRQPTIRPSGSSHTRDGKVSSRQGLRQKISTRSAFALLLESVGRFPKTRVYSAATRGMSASVNGRTLLMAVAHTRPDTRRLTVRFRAYTFDQRLTRTSLTIVVGVPALKP